MAEALGLVPSLAALLKLARYAKRFGSELYRFSKDAGGAMQEIQSFANSAKTFSLLVKTADVSLRKHCREHSDSDVLRYIAEHQVLDGIAQQANEVRGDLITAIDQLKFRFQSRFAVLVFIRWTFQKNPIVALFPAMESIKVSLQLMLSIAMLETLGATSGKGPSEGLEKEDDERDEEIRLLKEMIESQIRVMKQLTIQNEKIQNQRLFGPGSTASIEPIFASHEHLNQLAKTMVKTGRVPWDPMKREKMRSPSPATTTTHEDGSPTSSSLTPPSSPPGAPPSVDTANTPSSPALIVKLGTSLSSGEISAMMKSRGGQATRITIYLDSTATRNVIGLSLARRLDLEIEPYDHREKVLIDLGHRQVTQSVGKVTLKVNPHDSHRSPIPVECSVVENPHITLILGGPFVKLHHEVWGTRSGE